MMTLSAAITMYTDDCCEMDELLGKVNMLTISETALWAIKKGYVFSFDLKVAYEGLDWMYIFI